MAVPFLDLRAAHGPLRPALDACWARALDESAFIGGSPVERFEVAFAESCGVAHCVGVGNGTDAIELVLLALGIGAGDEVIVPANTFVATAEAVVNVGATPVFADVDPDTLLVTVDTVDAVVSPATAAVIAVHLYGQPVDAGALRALTDARGLALVEDAAQAHGARWAGTSVGSFGVAAAFSFYPGKNLGALGDGGAVVTDDGALAASIRSIANHGRSAGSAGVHDAVGRNSRLDALQAAVLEVKLAQLDAGNEARRQVHQRYCAGLADTPIAPVAVARDATAVHHLEVVQVPDRARAITALDRAQIGWGLHYASPCHLMAPYERFARGPLPVAEAAAAHILSLPMFPTLGAREVEHVCDVLRRSLVHA